MSKTQAEIVGKRIHVKSSFANKDLCKSVIGARWSPSVKKWTYPLDMETCRRLRDAFGDDLDIGHELWVWASTEKKRETHLHQFVNVTDIDIELPRVKALAPTMWVAMLNRPYQPVASYYMSKARRCLNGDQPGIGKTIETLGALVESDITGPILVLAPKTSCSVVWEPEIERWLSDYAYGFTVTQTAGLTGPQQVKVYAEFEALALAEPGKMHFLIANAEQVRVKKFTECPSGICDGDEDWCPELSKHRNGSETRRPFLHAMVWEAIIADETHKWLINTRGKHASQVGYGFTKLRTAGDESPMYALSGTPLKGKKWNLFGTLNWLRKDIYTSKWRWIGSYFEVIEDEYSRVGVPTGAWKSDRDKEAFFRSLNSIMIRRTKDELRTVNPAWMPPEKRYHDVWVELEGKQKTHYKAMEKNAAVSLGENRLTATGILAEMTRLKQFANSDGELFEGHFRPTLPSAKFTWLLQFLEERGIEAGGDLSDDVQKIVIASQFTSLIKSWQSALSEKGIKAYTLTGETPDKERAGIVDAFQTRDDVRVFMINTTAGGVSITLDAADDMVIMDETWVPDEQEQVEDRVHRASNITHQVDVWYVRTKDTIEEGIADTNADKAENNHVVLDAQRGLKFASERFGSHSASEVDHIKNAAAVAERVQFIDPWSTKPKEES